MNLYSVVGWADYGVKNRNDIGFLGEFIDSEESFELLQRNGDGCSAHEPYHSRVG